MDVPDTEPGGTLVAGPAAASVNREFVLTKCDYFLEVQLWPLRSKLNPERWLSNFEPGELEYAVHLLNAFIYYARPLIEGMFLAAFQGLSRIVVPPQVSVRQARMLWREFMDQAIITRVTGETPSDTDSAFQFVRMARQALRIPEAQILPPESALNRLYSDGPRPVVFVDDFLGSARQFLATWERQVSVGHGEETSFKEQAAEKQAGTFYYCPLMCTESGYVNGIAPACPQVIVSPAHFISSRYNALAPDSVLWPRGMRSSGPEFIRRASERAGIAESEWRGFNDLGLAIAFEHQVPDATLPLFWFDKNNWKPLVRRT